jgi:predicted nucleic acid-binding protein
VIGERLDAIYTYDRDFDGIPGVRRMEPGWDDGMMG